MNKNILIGLLAAVVVGGVVIYAINRNTNEPTAPNETSSSTPTQENNNSNPNPGGSSLVPGKPVVTTDPNISPTASTAVVSGRVYPNGAATNYWFEYGPNPDSANRTPAQLIGSGYVNIPTPAFITGLNPNTKYYFRLVAQNSFGKVLGTQYAFQTTLASPPAPGVAPAAQTNAASAIERTTATLNGHVDPNGTNTTYWFEYGQSQNLGSVSALQTAAGDASIAVSVQISGLNPQTKYWFRINAQNQYGTVNGSVQSFITKGPSNPALPTVNTSAATEITKTTATLNGRISPNGAATSYWFEYSQDSLLGNLLGTSTATSPVPGDSATTNVSTDIKDLRTNTRYYFRLVAQNSQGTVRGDIRNFRTLP